MQLGASVLVMGLQDAAAAARAESAVTVALSDGAESERETKAEEWARERTLDAVEEREP